MELCWLDPAEPDHEAIDGFAAVWEAARLADYPHEPPTTVASLRGHLAHGWDGDPPEAVVARRGRRVVGVAELTLPRWDNHHLAYFDVVVDPSVRRAGVGRALYDEVVSRIRAVGRTVVLLDCFDDTPGESFAAALGLERANREAKRRQHLARLDWPRLDGLFAEAQRMSAGYELVQLPAELPESLVPAVVAMTAAINDAPLDDLAMEDEVFSPERIRGIRVAQIARGRRLYQLAARHRGSGELAGHTMVAVEGELPAYAHQLDTSVLAAHRGHRLGLLLKIGMLRWLAEAEPQLQVLDTWNAASNSHMVAVNEVLGYELIATASAFQRRL